MPLAMTSIPWVSSQSYTSLSSTVTSVNQFSYVNTISTPVQSMASTISGEQTLVNGSYTVTGVNRDICTIETLSFNAQAGQTVTGLISSNQPSTLEAFMLSDQDYPKWQSASPSYCDPSDNNINVQRASSAGYLTRISINWTPPAEGKYWLAGNLL
jgi:hypothetical protein